MTINRYTESAAIKKISMLLDDEYRTVKGMTTACSQRMCSLLERTRTELTVWVCQRPSRGKCDFLFSKDREEVSSGLSL